MYVENFMSAMYLRILIDFLFYFSKRYVFKYPDWFIILFF